MSFSSDIANLQEDFALLADSAPLPPIPTDRTPPEINYRDFLYGPGLEAAGYGPPGSDAITNPYSVAAIRRRCQKRREERRNRSNTQKNIPVGNGNDNSKNKSSDHPASPALYNPDSPPSITTTWSHSRRQPCDSPIPFLTEIPITQDSYPDLSDIQPLTDSFGILGSGSYHTHYIYQPESSTSTDAQDYSPSALSHMNLHEEEVGSSTQPTQQYPTPPYPLHPTFEAVLNDTSTASVPRRTCTRAPWLLSTPCNFRDRLIRNAWKAWESDLSFPPIVGPFHEDIPPKHNAGDFLWPSPEMFPPTANEPQNPFSARLDLDGHVTWDSHKNIHQRLGDLSDLTSVLERQQLEMMELMRVLDIRRGANPELASTPSVSASDMASILGLKEKPVGPSQIPTLSPIPVLLQTQHQAPTQGPINPSRGRERMVVWERQYIDSPREEPYRSARESSDGGEWDSADFASTSIRSSDMGSHVADSLVVNASVDGTWDQLRIQQPAVRRASPSPLPRSRAHRARATKEGI